MNPLGFGTSTKTQSFSFAPPSPTSALSSFTKPCSTSTPHDTSARTRSRLPPDPERLQAALALLAEIGYPGVVEEDLGKLNPSDEYETELRVMAEVRGYFQVAYKVYVHLVILCWSAQGY